MSFGPVALGFEPAVFGSSARSAVQHQASFRAAVGIESQRVAPEERERRISFARAFDILRASDQPLPPEESRGDILASIASSLGPSTPSVGGIDATHNSPAMFQALRSPDRRPFATGPELDVYV